MRRKELIIYTIFFLTFITVIFIFMPAIARQEQNNPPTPQIPLNPPLLKGEIGVLKGGLEKKGGLQEGKGELSNKDGEDIKGIMKALEDRERELASREEALKKEEYRLNMLRSAIEISLKQYSAMRDRLQKELTANNNENSRSQQGIGHIAKIYESMSPEDAAQRIEKMDRDMAVELLSKIKNKQAAKILGAMSSEKATLLSEKIGTNKGANK